MGYYICAIGGDWVRAEEMELDHIISRSRRADLRFDMNNLQPTCHDHNKQKGSR
jgi:5-methylcytosine-specific restriction endonuclease McrA